MTLLGDDGQPDFELTRKLLAPPPGKRRLSFGRRDTRESRKAWDLKRDTDRRAGELQSAVARLRDTAERARHGSITEADSRIRTYERQAEALRKREGRLPFSTAPLRIEPLAKPLRNPYERVFSEQDRPEIGRLLGSMPPALRSVVTMALDPTDALPMATLGEDARAAVAGARQGSLDDFRRLVQSSDLLDDLTTAGKSIMGRRTADFEAKRREVERLQRVGARPVPHAARLEREAQILEDRELHRVRERAVRGRPPAEGTRAYTAKKYASFIEKLRGDYFPTHPDYKFEVDERNEGLNAFDEDGNFLRNFFLPSRLVEELHGQDMAEDFAITGFNALPDDSPLHRPSLGSTALRVLGDTAELLGVRESGEFLGRATKQTIKAHTGLAGALGKAAEGLATGESAEEVGRRLGRAALRYVKDEAKAVEFGANVVGKLSALGLSVEEVGKWAAGLSLEDIASLGGLLGEGNLLGVPQPSEGSYMHRFATEPLPKAYDVPRQALKKEVIEPVLPEFEVTVPTARILPYTLPGVAAAELALTGLSRLTGKDVTVGGVLSRELPNLSFEVDDETVAELVSIALDPFNLLPVVGFGSDIARISARLGARALAGRSVRAGLRELSGKVAARLGREEAFRNVGQAVKYGESGQISVDMAAGGLPRLFQGEEGAVVKLTNDEVAKLYDSHYAEIRNYINRRVDGDFSMAEDMTSDIFANLIRLNPEITTSAKAYLYTAAKRAVAYNARKRAIIARATEGLIDTELRRVQPSVEQLVEQAEFEAAARRAFSQLADDEKRIIALKQQGMSGREIAAELGLSEVNGRVKLTRTFAKMRKLLGQESGQISVDFLLSPIGAVAKLPKAVLASLGRDGEFIKAASRGLGAIRAKAAALRTGGEGGAIRKEVEAIESLLRGAGKADDPEVEALRQVLKEKLEAELARAERLPSSAAGLDLPEGFKPGKGIVGELVDETGPVHISVHMDPDDPRYVAADIMRGKGASLSNLRYAADRLQDVLERNPGLAGVRSKVVNPRLVSVLEKRMGLEGRKIMSELEPSRAKAIEFTFSVDDLSRMSGRPVEVPAAAAAATPEEAKALADAMADSNRVTETVEGGASFIDRDGRVINVGGPHAHEPASKTLGFTTTEFLDTTGSVRVTVVGINVTSEEMAAGALPGAFVELHSVPSPAQRERILALHQQDTSVGVDVFPPGANRDMHLPVKTASFMPDEQAGLRQFIDGLTPDDFTPRPDLELTEGARVRLIGGEEATVERIPPPGSDPDELVEIRLADGTVDVVTPDEVREVLPARRAVDDPLRAGEAVPTPKPPAVAEMTDLDNELLGKLRASIDQYDDLAGLGRLTAEIGGKGSKFRDKSPLWMALDRWGSGDSSYLRRVIVGGDRRAKKAIGQARLIQKAVGAAEPVDRRLYNFVYTRNADDFLKFGDVGDETRFVIISASTDMEAAVAASRDTHKFTEPAGFFIEVEPGARALPIAASTGFPAEREVLVDGVFEVVGVSKGKIPTVIVRQREAVATGGAIGLPDFVQYNRVVRDLLLEAAEPGFRSTSGFPEVRSLVDSYMRRTGKTAEELFAETRAAGAVPDDLLRPAAPRKAAAEVTEAERETLGRWLDEAEVRKGELEAGELGGGRVRPVSDGDVVKINTGRRAGERGVVESVRAGGQSAEIRLESGQLVRRATHQFDVVERRIEKEVADRELPKVTRERLTREEGIRREVAALGPAEGMAPEQKRALRALEVELEDITEQARLVSELSAAAEPGGPLATRAAQQDELARLKARFAKAARARRDPIRRRIAALEEVMKLGGRPAPPDPIDAVKEAYLASQSDELANLQRRSDELDFLLAKRGGVLSPEEATKYKAQRDEIIDELVRLRSETDEAAEQLTLASRVIEPGQLTPPTMRLEDHERFAFARTSPAGRFISRIPFVSPRVRIYDPSLYHADHFVGRKFVALGRLLDALDSSSEVAYFALKGKGKVFDVKNGVEATTGKYIYDVIEDWGTYRRLFGQEQDDFVQLLDKTRLEALRDAKILGIDIPEAWEETVHVFRRAYGKDGIEYRNLLADGGKAKPGSFKARLYETMEDAIANGVMEDFDFVDAAYMGMRSIREYAANRAFMDAIKWEKGVPLRLFVAQELRLGRALAAREWAWAKVVRQYAHQSVRGAPPKPALRASKLFEVEPPSDLVRITDRITELNRAKATPATRAELRVLRDEVDAAATAYSAKLRVARADYSRALESVNTQVQEGVRFGISGPVKVSSAPLRDFPELSGRLFLQDDIDYLIKLAGRQDNTFVHIARGAAKVSGVMKTFQTALDPGFWFIQGLGAMGLDFARSLPVASLVAGKVIPDIRANPLLWPLLKPFGQSKSIWGEAAWRSIVGLVNERAAAEYWASQASLHPHEWAEFIQHSSVLAGHQGHSDEIVQELVRGGFINKFERRLPGLKRAAPFTRAGNAFSNYLNAASWETWKALRPLAKTDHEVGELAAFVRNVSGRNRARSLGISRGQEYVERSLIYAREYTRASAAILAKAAFDPLSFGGRQAIKSLAGIGAAMTFTFGAVTLYEQLSKNGWDIGKVDWEDLGDDLRASWNPLSPSFMARRSGKTLWGVGGGMRSLVSAMTKIGAAGYYDVRRISGAEVEGKPTLNPIDFDSLPFVNWNHPFMRLFRGKSSPTVGMAWDLLSGRDYLGYTVDDPKDLLDPKGIGLQVAPFAMQAYLSATGLGTGERVGVGTAEWFGIRTVPVSKYQLYKEEAERSLSDEWGNLQKTDFLKQAEQDREQFPELHAAKLAWDDDQRAKANRWQEVDDLMVKTKDETEGKLVPLAIEINFGRPGGARVFSDQYKYLSAQGSDNFSIAAQALGIDMGEFETSDAPNKDAMLELQVAALEPTDYNKPDGSYDWDAYYAARDTLIGQMSPRNQRAFKEKRFNVGDSRLEKTLRLRAQAQEDLQDYLDIPKYKGLDNEQSGQVDKLIEMADMVRGQLSLRGIELSRGKFFQFLLESGYKGYEGSENPAVLYTAFASQKDALKPLVRGTAKRDYLFDHPFLPVFYDFTFFDMGEEDQEEWLDQFSKRTSSEILGLGAR